MDIRRHNRDAWDRQVEKRNPWTIPVGEQEIQASRDGDCRILLTPNRFVPKSWLEPLVDRDVLCLASGGGQQGPLLAAAGAHVTVLDNSPSQLSQDQRAAAQFSLEIRTVEGDMRDLSVFDRETFDLIVHPVSNVFVPDVRPVWKESHRVLRDGGHLLSGFCQPFQYIFDEEAYDRGVLVPRHSIPYSDLDVYGEDEIRRWQKEGRPLEFGHTLEDQIAGQLDAGFVITGLYEDRGTEGEPDPVSELTATFLATRACKTS